MSYIAQNRVQLQGIVYGWPRLSKSRNRRWCWVKIRIDYGGGENIIEIVSSKDTVLDFMELLKVGDEVLVEGSLINRQKLFGDQAASELLVKANRVQVRGLE